MSSYLKPLLLISLLLALTIEIIAVTTAAQGYTPLTVWLENPELYVGDEAVLYVEEGPPNTELHVYLDGELVTSGVTDEEGFAVIVFTVPLIPGGEHLVEVEATVNGQVYYGYTTLYILPKLIVIPEVVVVPGRIYIEVTGLEAGQLVEIYLDDGPLLAKRRADSNGYINTVYGINLPLVEPGVHVVRIVDSISGEEIVSAEIFVLGVLEEFTSWLVIISDTLISINEGVNTVLSKIDRINLTLIDIRNLVISGNNAILSRLGEINAVIIGIRDNTIYILTELGVIRANLTTIRELLEASRTIILEKVDENTLKILTDTGEIKVRLDRINATILAQLIPGLSDIKSLVTLGFSDVKSLISTTGDNIISNVNAKASELKNLIADVNSSVSELKSQIAETRDAVRAIEESIKPTSPLPIGVWAAAIFGLLATVISAMGLRK
jgi:hypothetical protein